MDVATRFQTRIRAQAYLDNERNAMPDDSEGDLSEPATRRKFQRTTATDSDSNNGFRKPSLPASATRPTGLEHRPSLTNRRRSTLRENVRVPSGPREFPSPGKRMGNASSTHPALSALDRTKQSSFLPPTSNDDAFYANQKTSMLGNTDNGSFSFGNGNHRSSTDETDSPTTPAERGSNDFDFVPTMNFDDFQSSITDPNWTSPLLSEFPTHVGGRALPKEQVKPRAEMSTQAAGPTFKRPALPKQENGPAEESGTGRTLSFRRRISAVPASRNATGSSTATVTQMPSASSQPNLSLRTRRQSTMPQSSTTPTQAIAGAGSANRTPRKSVGPGLLSLGDTRKGSVTLPSQGGEAAAKPSLSRTSSLSTKSRRTTLGPAFGNGDVPKPSTLMAPTQSRANKVKSLQPPPRQQNNDPDTPGSGRNASKANQNRAHTPSSSGNKRQSTASGRASGLGARTISPTDARRLKRMSMMQAPPMPTSLPKGPPTPSEELQQNPWVKPELPRLAQPSPSLIPRKMSTDTPISARGSPERGFYSFSSATPTMMSGGIQLSAKSSYQSLVSGSGSASTSRLPTPKPRNVHSSSARYEESNGELVPPVPAIPKAYDSPKEYDRPFFSDVGRGVGEPSLDGLDFEFVETGSPALAAAPSGLTPRGSMDMRTSSEIASKSSGEYVRKHQHKRSTTVASTNVATLAAKSSRPQPDPAGRKNANLQPLRLPPMSLMPLTTPTTNKIASLPRPSQEVDNRDDYATAQTPEPRRNAKTPSTPMTASKATFFRRQDEAMTAKLRSASSHYALRDLHMDHLDVNSRSFFDDSDAEGVMSAGGMPIPASQQQKYQRSAITPFASGSLPKGSGEFARMRSRPSAEYNHTFDSAGFSDELLGFTSAGKPLGPRPKTSGTSGSGGGGKKGGAGTPSSTESPVAEQAPQLPEVKKEKESGGLRRKLSLGWRRSSSKAASHAENKSSPQSAGFVENADGREKERGARLQKRQSEMPPPKVPASAASAWNGGDAGLARPSLENARRKSGMQASVSSSSALMIGEGGGGGENPKMTTAGVPRTRALHSEHPQPVPSMPPPMPPPAAHRSSSWAAASNSLAASSNHNFHATQANAQASSNGLSSHLGPIGKPSLVPTGRQRLTPATLNANLKDKDDLVADEEMRKLSTKRKDVDAAAKESEALKLRAVGREGLSPKGVLGDRSGGGLCIGGGGLNVFERGEIVDFEGEGIFFTGTKGCRKIVGSLSPTNSSSVAGKSSSGTGAEASGNHGYDDERGDYNIVLGDHLAYRYEVVDLLGKGSFGQVVRCVDHKEGGVVAVKIIRNKKRFHQQALVEVGILGRLGEWDPDGAFATLSITSSFYFRSHLCIVTPCLSINLYELIRSHNFTGFSLPLIRRMTRQLLSCLCLLQRKKIIHCDLKPENILLCEARKADVRVIDFGSSCRVEEKVYTYIQSRFYRSPEVILGSEYGLGIDMWSLGCILAELWTGYPLFPGENEQEQLACIMEIFGPPDRHLVERCTRKKLFFDSVGKPRVTVSSKGRRRRVSSKTLQQVLKCEDEAFLDFVARCLRWDPERRLRPDDAVGHPFVTGQPWGKFGPAAGIPEEARRGATRLRAGVAPVMTGGGGAGSPVKRKEGGNAFAQLTATTPAKDRGPARALPETPQTAVRMGGTGTNVQGSPSKVRDLAAEARRRHSSVASATLGNTSAVNGNGNGNGHGGGLGGVAANGASAAIATGMAGSKRASNGTLLGGGSGLPGLGGGGGAGMGIQQQRTASGAVGLAQMAARESMAGQLQQSSAARWRG
ncbi:serine/threonine protein kinase, CMGC, dual-specificity [Recurvomyces mirabilis]|nr:serine/threonine protein kinase, CMGC, dual-specificity [Recurvomyces mirabilis]